MSDEPADRALRNRFESDGFVALPGLLAGAELDDWSREQLLDGPVVAKNKQYFNRPPGVGQPTPAHQDGHCFMLDPSQALTIHRGDGNRSSTRSRRALGFIHYSERAREDSVAHEAYQRRLPAELKAAGRL